MSTQAAPQAVATTPHTGPAPAVTEAGHPRRWSVMAVLGAVAFMAQLDFFVVNVALDGIGQSFPGAGVASVSWVLSAYAIVFAAVLVPAGRVADQWGRKKVLLSGVAMFTLTSAVAAAAPNLGVLVGARALQAVGVAVLVALTARPTLTGFDHAWWVQAGAGLAAGVALLALQSRRTVSGSSHVSATRKEKVDERQ
ncbi:MFS transporter [Streptomyces sp. NPDC097640]|uniref:MFS transporter n=1 Tax=Streptomyces sp. NPDC097640 TaxID=3157229 RepID=UPI0033311E09